MLFNKKKQKIKYDPDKQIPVMRLSICTGEKTIGFKNIETGKYENMSLAESQQDIEAFCRQYGIDENQIKKEW